MLQLTSYARMLRYIGRSSSDDSALTDSKNEKQRIVNWIISTSKQIETFLNRWLQIESHTEYFDTASEKDFQFYVKGYPVSSLTSVYLSGDGLWAGEESEIDDCFIGSNSDSIVLPVPPNVIGKKTHRVIYIGGLAYNGVRNLLTVTGKAGTWSVGGYATGSLSEAVGIIKASTATTITLEVLYGIFEAEDVLSVYSDEDLSTLVSDDTATVSAVTRQALCESYPDIARACEIQIRHYWKHKDDFEVTSTNKDGTNQRRFGYDEGTVFIPEAMNLLMPYRYRGL